MNDVAIAMEEEIQSLKKELSFKSHECEKKDALIELRDIEIRRLKRKLRKAQKKVWYLETTKRKLDVALVHMKKQKIIDEKHASILEVIYDFFSCTPYI